MYSFAIAWLVVSPLAVAACIWLRRRSQEVR
jgi:hypothetical protein